MASPARSAAASMAATSRRSPRATASPRRLSVSTNGNRQSVTITPERTYIIKVQIGLGKAGGTPTAAALATR